MCAFHLSYIGQPLGFHPVAQVVNGLARVDKKKPKEGVRTQFA
jgi:hypothetical protein